jgi:ABC-type polysaccharide/polyol phosphate transport system ATPase subunit
VAVLVQGVTKVFARAERHSGSIKQGALSALSRRRRPGDWITALDGIDLTIHRGEIFGVIGPNGSGKSTLLKLIAGISEPTTGQARVAGRVLGLIELGAGFHPDLTGEENVRLQGALYGLTARQVTERMESILHFAGLEDFRHMPVRHYSSGMFVRLGFAIAIHCDPEVLLVDEVLAVGDQSFQERCMREIDRRRRRGLTIVLVTHMIEQAERLCDRIAWLEEGKLRMAGPTPSVVAAWRRDLIERRYSKSQGDFDEAANATGVPGRYGSGRARIERFRLLGPDGVERACVRRGDRVALEIDYACDADIQAVDCALALVTTNCLLIDYRRMTHDGPPSRSVDGRGSVRLELGPLPLMPGRYEITVGLSDPADPTNLYDMLYKLFYLAIEPEEDWDPVAPLELAPTVEQASENPPV